MAQEAAEDRIAELEAENRRAWAYAAEIGSAHAEDLERAESAEARIRAVEAEKAAILGQVDQAARLLAVGGNVIASATVRAQVARWPEFVALDVAGQRPETKERSNG